MRQGIHTKTEFLRVKRQIRPIRSDLAAQRYKVLWRNNTLGKKNNVLLFLYKVLHAIFYAPRSPPYLCAVP